MFKPDVLAKARVDQRYSQRQLAKAAGVNPSFIASLEAGNSKNPGYCDLVKVARVLALDPDVFFDPAAYNCTQNQLA